MLNYLTKKKKVHYNGHFTIQSSILNPSMIIFTYFSGRRNWQWQNWGKGKIIGLHCICLKILIVLNLRNVYVLSYGEVCLKQRLIASFHFYI